MKWTQFGAANALSEEQPLYPKNILSFCLIVKTYAGFFKLTIMSNVAGSVGTK